MPKPPLHNARVVDWLAPDLDRLADELGGTKVLVNSAAVWWFAHSLPPGEQAKILGAFVSHNALRRQAGDDAGNGQTAAPRTNGQRKVVRRGK